MANLLSRLNADAFVALMNDREQYSTTINELLQTMQQKDWFQDLTQKELWNLSMHLPKDIWDGNIRTLVNLFQTRPITNP